MASSDTNSSEKSQEYIEWCKNCTIFSVAVCAHTHAHAHRPSPICTIASLVRRYYEQTDLAELDAYTCSWYGLCVLLASDRSLSLSHTLSLFHARARWTSVKHEPWRSSCYQLWAEFSWVSAFHIGAVQTIISLRAGPHDFNCRIVTRKRDRKSKTSSTLRKREKNWSFPWKCMWLEFKWLNIIIEWFDCDTCDSTYKQTHTRWDTAEPVNKQYLVILENMRNIASSYNPQNSIFVERKMETRERECLLFLCGHYQQAASLIRIWEIFSWMVSMLSHERDYNWLYSVLLLAESESESERDKQWDAYQHVATTHTRARTKLHEGDHDERNHTKCPFPRKKSLWQIEN